MFLNSSKDAQKPEQIPNGLATSESASELQVVPQRAVPMEDEERSEVSVFNFEPESLELVFPSALTQRQGHSPHKLTSWPSDSSLTSGYLSDELNSPKQSILEDEPPLSPPRVLLDISTPFQQTAPGPTGMKICSVSSCCFCFLSHFLKQRTSCVSNSAPIIFARFIEHNATQPESFFYLYIFSMVWIAKYRNQFRVYLASSCMALTNLTKGLYIIMKLCPSRLANIR